MEEIRGILQAILEGQQTIVARLDGIDTRLERVETRLDRVETRLDILDANQKAMEKRLSGQIKDIDSSNNFLAGELGQHKKDINLLKEKVE